MSNSMRNNSLFAIFAIFILIVTTFSFSFVSAQSVSSPNRVQNRISSFSSTSSSSYTTHQSRPSYDTYYGSRANEYWPILGDKEICEARQDILLGISPFGCQPAVVRSDLLAEQNVPVFCQIDAAKINPLIDINQIRNIRFAGDYPIEVAGVGFHPAKAALRTRDKLLGSPLINNIGYVVVILKKQPEESKLPNNVNLTLSAQIDYISGNAYGIGKTEFALEKSSDQDWDKEKLKNSFWNGRYFIRLEEATSEFADISIYNGDRKIVTTRVERDKPSRTIYVPGMYCRAGLQINYQGYTSAEDSARIEISSDSGHDIFDIYDGSRIYESCSITNIDIGSDGKTGSVSGSCEGEKFYLSINSTKNNSVAISTQSETFYLQNPFNEIDLSLNNILDKNKASIGLYINKTKVINSSYDIVGSISRTSESSYRINLDKNKISSEFHSLDGSVIIGSTITSSPRVAPVSDLSKESEKFYQDALKYYEQVADDFPDEPSDELMNSSALMQKFGEDGLQRAISLAEAFARQEDKRILINRFLDIYPDSELAPIMAEELTKIETIDFSEASAVVEFDDRTRIIRLVDFKKPKNKASAEILVEGRRETVKLDETRELFSGGVSVGNITLDSVDAEQIRIISYCTNPRTGLARERRTETLRLDENSKEICGLKVKLDKVNSAEIVKIRLDPVAQGTETLTNFSVNIGIEKRDIKLSPDKAQEKIDKLEDDIKEWEDISDKLGNAVSGLKAACFGVSAALTFKNFISGLSGETIARQQVMNGEKGWTNICRDMIAKGEKGYTTLDQCFIGESSNIDKDVDIMADKIQRVNSQIKNTQTNFTNSPDGIGGIFGKNIDEEKARIALAEQARNQCAGKNIDLGNKKYNGKSQISINDVLTPENAKDGVITSDEIREIMLQCELDGSGLSTAQSENQRLKTIDNIVRIEDARVFNQQLSNQDSIQGEGWGSISPVSSSNQATRVMDVSKPSEEQISNAKFSSGVTHTSRVLATTSTVENEKSQSSHTFSGTYILGLEPVNPATGEYNVKEIWDKDNNRILTPEERGIFLKEYGIGNIKAADRVTYNNEIASIDRKVKYYETEPYKGMPAVVPFNIREGWYAGTRQTLPAFGGIGAFDASGKVSSFWLCNVGENKRIEFESGLGDDICQQINLNTGQPLGYFPGVDETRARNLVTQGINAIEEAARQYGNNQVTINGQRLQIGAPSVGIPGTKCQDFMSPKDCHLMFNVCDPVICPSSRCDFGGKFPVANVAQTGIAGSALLCLPNIKEGIVIPVCLTGIKAGIDGLLSIMRNYRDCLKENVETGRLVGICDQIYSVYMCEFFWGQIAPFVNVLVPKLLETFYGQGTRGGAEYLTVNAAWQNMENSIDYFTQSYAVNSLKSFQARSGAKFGGSNYILEGGVSEIGAELCDSFISAKAPNAFKTLIEPDSPPQFHAWFDSKKFSSATVPATAQYKVFYHIFAGNDEGVHFNVYLRSPPDSSYYAIAPRVQVDSGFVARGEYASQTRDFTAPEGYQELCVRINNEEECGFKQVSTSFAINQIRDSYVSDQALNKNIQSEKECVSGSPDPRTLLTPNIQAGAEETLFPEVYNRGIIRICSSRNPGSTTDPSRFVDMGYCGDQKIRCWLDKKSVSNAITDNNIGVLNETLQDLEKTAIENLAKEGQILTEDGARGEIFKIKEEVKSLDSTGEKVSLGLDLISKIEAIEQKTIYNHQKAELLLLKGAVNHKIALSLLKNEQKKERSSIVPTPSAPSGSGEQAPSNTISLAEAYSPDKRINILINGNPSVYFILEMDVSYKSGEVYIEIGKIISSEGEIDISDNVDFNSHRFLEGRIIPGYFQAVSPKDVNWDYDSAIAKANSLPGDYSDNKDFVDALHDQGLITDEQYDEINGNYFGGKENMDYVSRCLQVNKIKTNDKFTISSSGSIYYNSDYTGLGINDRQILYNRENVGSIGGRLQNLEIADQTKITITSRHDLLLLGKFKLGDLNGKTIINKGNDVYRIIEDFDDVIENPDTSSSSYSLGVPSTDGKIYVFLGTEQLGIYFEGNKIYAEFNEATTLVGAIAGDRMNIALDEIDPSLEIYRHLSNLDDKLYSDLQNKKIFNSD